MLLVSFIAGAITAYLVVVLVACREAVPIRICSSCDSFEKEKYTNQKILFITEGKQTNLPTIFCLINTYSKTLESKAIHVHHTWARRCTKTVFTTAAQHPVLKTLKLALSRPETRSHLWSKFRASVRVIRHELSQFDYFYRADDDTHTVMENILPAIARRSPYDPFMTGHRWTSEPLTNHFSGGGGILISQKAMSAIVEEAIDKHPRCPAYDGWKEDLYIDSLYSFCCQVAGKTRKRGRKGLTACGVAVGVKLYDTSAEDGKPLFYFNSIRHYFDSVVRKWSSSAMQIPTSETKNIQLAEQHISFHYMNGCWQYIMEFLTYYAWPLGLRSYDHGKAENL